MVPQKVLKAFIKPFEVRQSSVKIKFKLIFYFSTEWGWEGLISQMLKTFKGFN